MVVGRVASAGVVVSYGYAEESVVDAEARGSARGSTLSSGEMLSAKLVWFAGSCNRWSVYIGNRP